MPAPMILTAEQARSIKPRWDARDALGKIENLIRVNAATRTEIDIPLDLLPEHGVRNWANGQPGEPASAVCVALEDAGYRITCHEQGPSGYPAPPRVVVSW
jgi:hypothetical protein